MGMEAETVMSFDAIESCLKRGKGAVHLLGVAGFGMAGLAILLQARGFRVSGCDLRENRLTDRLKHLGVKVMRGHDPAHIESGLSAVIRSTAVSPAHPEVRAARERGVPVCRRGEVLAGLIRDRRSIAVSGTHGKTTTAAMMAQVLCRTGFEPDYFVGGEMDHFGGVAASGRGEWMVVEADESDGTVSLYEPDIAVITGVDYDHMEHFDSEEEFVRCFQTFADRTRERLYYCGEDRMAERVCAHRGISYGLGRTHDYHVRDLVEEAQATEFSLYRNDRRLGKIRIPVSGRHNVLNALAACAVCYDQGVSVESLSGALSRFEPVRRRFERICGGRGIEVYSDYAHHPAEIRAVMDSARRLKPRRVVAIFQPHRYSRTRALGPDFPPAFDGVDELILAPVYAASEHPVEGGTVEDLRAHFRTYGRISVVSESSLEAAWNRARDGRREGDLLLIIGAGDVETIAEWARAEWGA